VIPNDANFFVPEQSILQDGVGSQPVAPMNECNAVGELRQEQRLLDRGISAADDDHRAIAEKEAIASGARRDAEALENRLALQPQPTCGRSGTNDQRVASVQCARVADSREWSSGKVDADDGIVDHARSHVERLPIHLFHHPRPLHNFSVPRIILDIRRYGQLAARLQAPDEQRGEVGARRIDGRRTTGWTGSQDEYPAVLRQRHGGKSVEEADMGFCFSHSIISYVAAGKRSTSPSRAYRVRP
jgi:hypothetical protein